MRITLIDLQLDRSWGKSGTRVTFDERIVQIFPIENSRFLFDLYLSFSFIAFRRGRNTDRYVQNNITIKRKTALEYLLE